MAQTVGRGGRLKAFDVALLGLRRGFDGASRELRRGFEGASAAKQRIQVIARRR